MSSMGGNGNLRAFLVLAIAGIALSLYHWAGIIVAGIAAGLAASKVRDAVVYGIAAGLVIWMIFTAYGYSVAGAKLMDAFFIWIALVIALTLSVLSSIAAYGVSR